MIDDEEEWLRGNRAGGGGGGKRRGSGRFSGYRASRSRAGSGPKPQRNFAILRTAKIGTMGQMAASLQHTFRERETPNADPERAADNEILIGPDNSGDVAEAWRDRAPEKVRKNAVRAVEYLITGSPHGMARMGRAEQDAYFAAAVDWLAERHGRENILSAVIHRDEATPHLTAMVIPLDERGKLNARHFLGGREKLAAMQTDFADRVARPVGLERGQERSRARHERVQRFYGALDRADRAEISLPEPQSGSLMRRGESLDDYRARAQESASEALRDALSASEGVLRAEAAGWRQEAARSRSEAQEARSRAGETSEELSKTQSAMTRLEHASMAVVRFHKARTPEEREAAAQSASTSLKQIETFQRDPSDVRGRALDALAPELREMAKTIAERERERQREKLAATQREKQDRSRDDDYSR